jgi:predicted RNase H-like HicB family nuclease
MRQVIIYPGEDGYWVVECPSLPGCISQGKTKEEALINIKEAIELYIEVCQEKGQPLPEDPFEIMVVAV